MCIYIIYHISYDEGVRVSVFLDTAVDSGTMHHTALPQRQQNPSSRSCLTGRPHLVAGTRPHGDSHGSYRGQARQWARSIRSAGKPP